MRSVAEQTSVDDKIEELDTSALSIAGVSMARRLPGSTAFVGAFLMVAGTQSNAAALPDRIVSAAEASVADGIYQTLVFGVIDGDQGTVITFGKLDNGKEPDADTVCEIGSVTATFTARRRAPHLRTRRTWQRRCDCAALRPSRPASTGNNCALSALVQ